MTEKKIVIGLSHLISVSLLCSSLISDELFLVRGRRDGKQYGMSSWYGAGDYSAGANRLQFQVYILKLFIPMANTHLHSSFRKCLICTRLMEFL